MMRKMMIISSPDGGAESYPFRPNFYTCDIRQELEPGAPDESGIALNSRKFGGTSTYYSRPMLKISPDKKRLIILNGYQTSYTSSGANGNNFNAYPDIDDLSNVFAPSFTVSGTPVCVDCSNTHFVIGDHYGNIMLVEWDSLSLSTVNTTGIGTIRDVFFSEDGLHLYVIHAKSPYLRLYSIDNMLEYIDADPSFFSNTHSTYGLSGGIYTDRGILCRNYGNTSSIRDGFILISHDLSQRLGADGSYRSGSKFHLAIYDSVNDIHIIFAIGESVLSENTISTVKIDEAGLLTVNSISRAIYNQYTINLYVRSVFLDKETHRLIMGITKPGSLDAVDYDEYGKPIYLFEVAVDDLLTGDYTVTPAREEFVRILRSPEFGIEILEKDIHRVTGSVRDVDNLPAERVVRAYRRRDGYFMAETRSDPATGDYEIILPDAGPYDIQFMTVDGELLNDLFYARTEPEPL